MITRGMSMRHRSASSADESEALQTDTMRFFAIVCMCLMIVFSLVKSMPMSDTGNRPKIQNKTVPETEIQALKKKAAELKQVVTALETEIALKIKNLERKRAEIRLREKTIAQLNAITQKKVMEIKKKEHILSDLKALVNSAKAGVKKFRQMSRNAEQKLPSGRSEFHRTASSFIKKGRKELKKVESDLIRVNKGLKKLDSGKNLSEPGKKLKQETFAKKDSRFSRKEKEGFSLCFASNGALLHLLKQGNQSVLYMISSGRSWKLRVAESGAVNFIPSPPPEKIYEMDRRTVPEKIIRAGKKVIAAFGREAVTYGVSLSPGISSQLKSLMHNRKGGDLVISSQGRVTIE